MQKRNNTLDYLSDPSFKKWALYQKDGTYWNAYLEKYPEEIVTIKQAKEEILTLATPVQQSSSLRKAENWLAIKQAVESTDVVNDTNSQISTKRYRLPYRFVATAASLLLIAIFSLYILKYWETNKMEYITYISTYGDTKSITLPDSSQVLLIGKGSLRTLNHWNTSVPREVWLSGNAEFKVQHIHKKDQQIQLYDRFIVHTPLQGQIEVLGTEFSIQSLLSSVHIHLLNGSISVNQFEHALKIIPGQTVMLFPDKKPTVQAPAVLMDWKNKELQLNNAPVSQVAQVYKNVFGRAIHINQQVDTLHRLDGIIPFDNATQALKALSTLLNTSIQDYPLVAPKHED